MLLLALCCVLAFPAAGTASVMFEDGDYVRIGYSTLTPPIWRVKNLPEPWADARFFVGPQVSTAGVFNSTIGNSWLNSDIRSYLNGTYLSLHFNSEELLTGVLTPYGSEPVITAPEVPDDAVAEWGLEWAISQHVDELEITTGSSFDTEGVGDSLVWLPSVNEILALYNGSLVPCDDPLYFSPRLEYSLGSMGGYWTRSPDEDDISKVWVINFDGSFSSTSAYTPSILARPVISADQTVMLYKRGIGSEFSPYEICYPWQIDSTSISASAAGNLITLSFPEAVVNNGAWPRADAWEITDDIGASYIVIGATNRNNSLVLTVYPAIAPNAKMNVKYTQRYDDEAQGLNNTGGAILRSSMPYFALAALTLEFEAGDSGLGAGNSNFDSISPDITNINVNSSYSGCDSGLGIGALLLLFVTPIVLKYVKKDLKC